MVYKYKGQKVSEVDEAKMILKSLWNFLFVQLSDTFKQEPSTQKYLKSIAQLADLSLLDLSKWFKEAHWSGRQKNRFLKK